MKNKKVLSLVLFGLAILMFVGGFGSNASRSMYELWNLGHILFFGLLIYQFNNNWHWYCSKKIVQKIVLVFILTAILSIIIELSQHIFASGTPDISDIRRNFVGALLGFVFTVSSKKKYILNFLRFVAILFVLSEMVPVSLALADEFRASRKFPILSDFESDLELSRWSGDEKFLRNKEIVFHGKSSLFITFGTSKYSGVSLKYFPGDWTKYKFLEYSIYYPYADTLYFTCRIHDEQHTKGVQAYNDRFNGRYFLVNGWNEILIKLEDVKNGPRTRKMDMSKVQNVAIFTVQLSQPKMVYLDYVRLEM